MNTLSDVEELLLHGHCHLFAVALNDLSGLPIAAYIDVDLMTEQTVLVHAFVIDGEDAIDIRGRVPLDDVLDEFDYFNPELVVLSKEQLLELAHGTLDEKESVYLAAKAIAEAVIKNVNKDSETIVSQRNFR